MRATQHLLLLLVGLASFVPFVAAQAGGGSGGPAAGTDDGGEGGAAGPVEIEVGLHLVNFGNYDVNKGTYTMDFYLWFRWDTAAAPDGFSPEKFEFMNGRATSKERIFDETGDDGWRELWYRVQASLYSDPRFEEYPYDTQTLEVRIEDAVHPSEELVYVAPEGRASLDEQFRVAGWRILGLATNVTDKGYPFDESYSRFVATVRVVREPFAQTLRSFLPPVAFVVVSGLSFFFHPSKVAQRLTLGTSGLIAAVAFHISQTIGLPSLGQLSLFDQAMLACYSFLAASLAVTTLISIDEDFWKDRDHTRAINRWGAVGAVALPVLLFLVLRLT